MLIYNQDRDETFDYVGEDHNFYSQSSWYKGVFMGISLFVDCFRLGGFDSVQEIIDEINAIMECPGDVYYVSGYSDYDGADDWNQLYELMAESEARA
jgi:hypothetical protein